MANTTADKLAKLESTKSALKTAINGSGSTVGDVFSTYPTAITDGKSQIASAITEKGVSTSASDTFSQMASNINAIEGEDMYWKYFPESQYEEAIAYSRANGGMGQGACFALISMNHVSYTGNPEASIPIIVPCNRYQLYNNNCVFNAWAGRRGEIYSSEDNTKVIFYFELFDAKAEFDPQNYTYTVSSGIPIVSISVLGFYVSKLKEY